MSYNEKLVVSEMSFPTENKDLKKLEQDPQIIRSMCQLGGRPLIQRPGILKLLRSNSVHFHMFLDKSFLDSLRVTMP